MNILEFSIKAFVLLLKCFARGSKNCLTHCRRSCCLFRNGIGEGRSWMAAHCSDSGRSAVKMITPAAVIQGKCWSGKLQKTRKTTLNLTLFLVGMSLVDVGRFMFPFYLIRVNSWSWRHELASEVSVDSPVHSELGNRDRNRWNKLRYTFWSVLSKAKILNLNISHVFFFSLSNTYFWVSEALSPYLSKSSVFENFFHYWFRRKSFQHVH